MVELEGLSAQEALAWCGDDTLTGREVHRLIRGVVDEGEELGGAVGGEDQGTEKGVDARGDAPSSAGPAESMPG